MFRYELENLAEEFKRHGEQMMTNEHFNDHMFCLPVAMYNIIQHIIVLEDEITQLKASK